MNLEGVHSHFSLLDSMNQYPEYKIFIHIDQSLPRAITFIRGQDQ